MTDLTRDEILNMPAGREMDALIAERVMGWEIHPHKTHYIHNDGKTGYFVPCGEFQPSEDIAAAWQVVERMRYKNFYSQHTDLTLASENEEWWSWTFIDHNPLAGYSEKATAETAPLAICRAALLAVMDCDK